MCMCFVYVYGCVHTCAYVHACVCVCCIFYLEWPVKVTCRKKNKKNKTMQAVKTTPHNWEGCRLDLKPVIFLACRWEPWAYVAWRLVHLLFIVCSMVAWCFQFIYLSLSLSLSLSVYLYLSIYLSIYLSLTHTHSLSPLQMEAVKGSFTSIQSLSLHFKKQLRNEKR